MLKLYEKLNKFDKKRNFFHFSEFRFQSFDESIFDKFDSLIKYCVFFIAYFELLKNLGYFRSIFHTYVLFFPLRRWGLTQSMMSSDAIQ